jgi:hypothetical protein
MPPYVDGVRRSIEKGFSCQVGEAFPGNEDILDVIDRIEFRDEEDIEDALDMLEEFE